jgi:tRNA dimethylallyltransferase
MEQAETIPVLVLFGPTASGKTGVLLRLFGSGGYVPAEIVSADSMQVYRGMDIGTAKPSPEQREQLPHHLIDICDPSEQFSAGDFARLAGEAIKDIAGRGKLPAVSGGAGFYLKNLILGLPEAPPSDAAIRGGLKLELEEKGAAALMDELARFDPASARKIHINDEYRLLRALEVLRLCGRPLSSYNATGVAPNAGSFRFTAVGLFRPREELYRRIDERCAAMFDQGLPGEVSRLYDAGYTPRDPGLRAIGYREFFVNDPDSPNESGFRLSRDLAGVRALIARNSRRYAKRQITFFASLPDAKRVMAGRNDDETAERLYTEILHSQKGNEVLPVVLP